MSFSFEKVTTGTYNFVSFISNVVPNRTTIAGSTSASTVISAKTQFLDQVKINSTSQLINRIFKALQKLLQCFSGITTSAFANESLSSGVFPTIFVLYLKDSEIRERGFTWFISIIISQVACCFSVIFTVFKQIVHRYCIINFYTINF